MIDDTVGLGRRLVIEARRIARQHERLGEIWTAFLEPLANKDLAGARPVFAALADGLRAHFAIEEEVEIPALHGRDHSRTEALQRIIDDHAAFRIALDRLTDALERDDLAVASAEAAALAAAITDHERREEAIFEGRHSA